MIPKNDSQEENHQEKKKLTELIFEKAKSESMEKAKSALANYIEDNSELNSKTLTRMYDRYIMGDNKKPIPTMFNLNLAAQFIGYESFAEFCHKIFIQKPDLIDEMNEDEKQNNFGSSVLKSSKKNYLKTGLLGLGVASVIGLSSYLGGNSTDCMFWDETHYSAINCDEKIHPETDVIPYDEQLIKYFYKIEPTDTTTFFKAGEAVVWYVKIDGKPELFSAGGKHPINGKELRKITPYIVEKYFHKSK